MLEFKQFFGVNKLLNIIFIGIIVLGVFSILGLLFGMGHNYVASLSIGFYAYILPLVPVAVVGLIFNNRKTSTPSFLFRVLIVSTLAIFIGWGFYYLVKSLFFGAQLL